MHEVGKRHVREIANPTAKQYIGHLETVPKIKIEGRESEEGEEDRDWHSAASITSVLDENDIRSFRALSHGIIGRLVVFPKGIRYVQILPKKELWRYDFLDLVEMRKIEGLLASKLAFMSPNQLEITCIDGSKLHLEGMGKRNEAFNTIIAFSGLQWQSLQCISNSKAQA